MSEGYRYTSAALSFAHDGLGSGHIKNPTNRKRRAFSGAGCYSNYLHAETGILQEVKIDNINRMC